MYTAVCADSAHKLFVAVVNRTQVTTRTAVAGEEHASQQSFATTPFYWWCTFHMCVLLSLQIKESFKESQAMRETFQNELGSARRDAERRLAEHSRHAKKEKVLLYTTRLNSTRIIQQYYSYCCTLYQVLQGTT